MGWEFTIKKNEEVRVDHEKKTNGIREDHEKKRDRVRGHHEKVGWGESSQRGRAMGYEFTIRERAMG